MTQESKPLMDTYKKMTTTSTIKSSSKCTEYESVLEGVPINLNQGDSDGDKPHISINYRSPSPQDKVGLYIPAEHLGNSIELSAIEIQGVPGFLLISGGGIDSWYVVYLLEGDTYKTHSTHGIDGMCIDQEDNELMKMKPLDMVKYLYLKGLN